MQLRYLCIFVPAKYPLINNNPKFQLKPLSLVENQTKFQNAPFPCQTAIQNWIDFYTQDRLSEED